MKLSSVCHNPIFTSGIFSGVDTQNETTWTKPDWPNRSPPHQKNLKTGPGHISRSLGRFDQVWPGLTKFDRGLTETLTRPKAGSSRSPPNYWIEHVESFDSVLYGSEVDEKRGSYGQNRGNRSNTWPNFAKCCWQNSLFGRQCLRIDSFQPATIWSASWNL